MANYYNSHLQTCSSRTLEITVLSGEDLRIGKRPVKKNTFVTIRFGGDEFRSTAIDEEGGSYPRWNEKLVLDAPSHAQAAITVEVHCRTTFGDRVVGTASVPASDYSGGYVPESYLHFLSYRLRDSRGERNGIINISVRTSGTAEEKMTCSASASSSQRVTVGLPVGKSISGGVVTGVPLWVSSYNGKHY